MAPGGLDRKQSTSGTKPLKERFPAKTGLRKPASKEVRMTKSVALILCAFAFWVSATAFAQQPRDEPAPPAPAHGNTHGPKIFTLRSGIAEGRMVFLGVGGDINGQVNPTLNVHEGEAVQINLVNGE